MFTRYMSTNLESPLKRFATESTGVLFLNFVWQRLCFWSFIFVERFSLGCLCNFLGSKRYGNLKPLSIFLSGFHSVVYRAIILLLSFLDSFATCAVISFDQLINFNVHGFRELIAARTIFWHPKEKRTFLELTKPIRSGGYWVLIELWLLNIDGVRPSIGSDTILCVVMTNCYLRLKIC